MFASVYKNQKISVLLLVLIFVAGLIVIKSESLRYRLIQSPMFQQLVPTYRSVRKLPDLVFSPYFFYKTRLPVYKLVIKKQDLATLNAGLPDPFGAPLLDDNRVRVKADFAAGDFRERVELRYRGFKNNHWAAAQKSWRINFSKESRFQGMKGLNLVIPYDRLYFIELLNAYRARKLGLNVPDIWFVRLKINGWDAGVYMAWEQWSNRWLSRSGLPDTSHILAVDDGKPGLFEDTAPLFSREGLRRWKSYTQNNTKSFPELEALVEIIEKTDDTMFTKLIPHIIDLPKFYAWHALRALADSAHQWEAANLIVIFNTATGKFETVPFDMGMEMGEYLRDEAAEKLASRVFSIPEFRKERDEVLKSYLNEDNLRDDLAFYDSLARRMKPEFLSDSLKFHSNLKYLSEISRLRDLTESNFQKATAFLGRVSPPYFLQKTGSLVMPTEFARFPEISRSLIEFLAYNPRFYALDEKTVSLGTGTTIITETTIIPAGVTLRINAGTTLLLGEGVSLVSYGPVEIVGSSGAPVIVAALDAQKPWGSILILNNSKTPSRVEFAQVSGGSGVEINGIRATGMLAVHDSDLEVSQSIFSDSHDDDAINVKYGRAIIRRSTFFKTNSDALDFDAVDATSIVEDNTFASPLGTKETGGDAIDLSFSQVLIQRNIILGCADKGISVGEASRPIIIKNVITSCSVGVAVKDSSRARIFSNIFKEDDVAISAYQKKHEFGGGYALVINPTFLKNKEDIKSDGRSQIEVATPLRP
ncbi:MAG: CotH kinase family protein [Candidatus Sungiibacteriota bacterium]|uniref:CotH kinase family protein n=1 Tax=Candidatus Sungiibacteriota bacterium TaxID=2750080 RepID=A0A7T5RJW6_9BACT|nr:MAG: CotH kinase family protein [Candidatus Sungbacteria bacterium]